MKEVPRDTLEIWERKKSAKRGGKDVITAMIFPLPDGAGIHKYATPAGTVTVDMSFGKINPKNEIQQVAIKSPKIPGITNVDLIRGRGRIMPNDRIEVVFNASRLTKALEADNRRTSSRNGW